jgi:hypothetical protein
MMKNRFAAMSVLIVATLAFMFQAGCTPTKSEAQVNEDIQRNAYWESRMFVEDWGLFLMTDRNTRLSRWHYTQ